MDDKNPTHNGTVLLILEDLDLIDQILGPLTKANYKVSVAPSARHAFLDLFKTPPDAIILDINLPDLDGFHVARELKRSMMLRHIPVILLSNDIGLLDKLRTFDVVVDEYLVKPFNVQDMLLRTNLVIQRSQTNLDANPLTRLPGNNAIVKAIKSRIGSGKPYAIGYLDLNNFKSFNDKYGFSKGDQVILFTAQVIMGVLQKLSPRDHFVGHIGGDDFIFICDYDKANEVCQMIAERFDAKAPKFYSEEDQKKGYVVVEDRRGIVSQIPLVSVAIGLVSDEGKKFSNLGQINHSLTQLKKYAKSFQGSAFVRDRRNWAAQLAEFTWGPGSAAGSSNVLDSITTALGSLMPDQLKDIIHNETLSVLFQPILDMRIDEVVAHESLIRGPSGTPLEFPDALFQTARTANCVLELDILCLKKIAAAARELHKGVKLFINIFPETLLEGKALQGFIDQGFPKNIDFILELSGSHRSNDVGDLYVSLRKLREQGVKICLDANVVLSGQGLKLLSDLRPDFVKLNMMVYKDMTHDTDKQSEFSRTINMIRQSGTEIVCTKLESRADSFLALKAGLTLGQGFLFARPAQTPMPLQVK